MKGRLGGEDSIALGVAGANGRATLDCVSFAVRAGQMLASQVDGQLRETPADAAAALAGLAQRSMQLQLSVQDGTAWVSETLGAVEVTPLRLFPA